MSLAQYRRIIKGNWSNSNEQKRLDESKNEEDEQLKKTDEVPKET